MAVLTEHDTYCTEIDHPGGGRGYDGPPEYCNGDPVPHSDLCEQHGGEADLEAFLEEWTDHVHELSGVCECITEYEGADAQVIKKLKHAHGEEALSW